MNLPFGQISKTVIGNHCLYLGDCIEVMRGLQDNSFDSCVCDPPYELGFMGKAWDQSGIANKVDLWIEVLRLLKPGAHLLAFSHARTYHRMVCAIEDAGFDIRDQIMWIYGSGFPKSHNQDGVWQGWGTALKPAHEPIVLARKPLAGTVAQNLGEYGAGALNIDGCRIGETGARNNGRNVDSDIYGKFGPTERVDYNKGRWPANVIHDGSNEVLAAFPDSKGQQGATTGNEPSSLTNNVYGKFNGRPASQPRIENEKSTARFFYCAKASKKDRDEGMAGPEKSVVTFQTANGTSGKASSWSESRATEYKNTHPTVKPTELMRYLCRLVTRPGGMILDPFTGSGSTGKAAALEGFKFTGIDKEEEYIGFAAARIQYAAGMAEAMP